MGFSTPVGLVIALVILASGEDLVRIGYCLHCHLTNSIIEDCFFGKVHFLGPLIWKVPLEVVIISPPLIFLARVVSGLLTSF